MDITLRPNGINRFCGYLVFALVPVAVLLLTNLYLSPKSSVGWVIFFAVTLSFGLVMATLDAFVVRLVANDQGITIYNRWNRVSLKVTYSQIDRYCPDRLGRWGIYTNETWTPMPEVEIGEIHRIIRLYAPRAMAAKRWKCGQLPPTEEFRNISTFDGQKSLAALTKYGLVGLPLIFLHVTRSLGYYVFLRLLPTVYDLNDLFRRLDLTDRGIGSRGFGRQRFIEWDQINAVFCHQVGKDRSFVAVSQTTAIPIPRPIASDLDAMRKFFYSLPDGTPCVNFDENFRKGYRRKKRKGIRAPSSAPELAGGSF